MSKSIRRLTDEGLLERILDTPHLADVVPRLQPELLHRVIQRCGLEDCGELVALTTPTQLARLLDLDLWRVDRPGLSGMDARFDGARFGVWLETLVEMGASVAAAKLAQMDVHLVITGLAQHARVFDAGAVAPYMTTDGQLVPGRAPEDSLSCHIGGYAVQATRADEAGWDAIVAVLIALDAEHPAFFHRVLSGCRLLSDAGREVDGLDVLLGRDDQKMFDLAADRERRREQQGFATPAQARAFLEMSRRFQPAEQRTAGEGGTPAVNPIARAYFQALEDAGGTVYTPPSSEEEASAVVEFLGLLTDAGLISGEPRALLGSGADRGHSSTIGRLRAHMQVVFERDPAAYAARSAELAYLANTLLAGCSIQGRAFTEQESSEAAVAICNLGVENWPPAMLIDDFLVHQDLISVFQAGWAVLYRDVSTYAAEQLVAVLKELECSDREIQTGLTRLRIGLAKHLRIGEPWRSQGALEAIAILDMPAWATLRGLIDECPVLPEAIAASQGSRTRSVSASAFAFIAENRQIAAVRAFMQALPQTLAG